MNSEDEARFDAAAAEAENELRLILEKMTKEERDGLQKMSAWWKKHYTKAGHKRLGRVVAFLKF